MVLPLIKISIPKVSEEMNLMCQVSSQFPPAKSHYYNFRNSVSGSKNMVKEGRSEGVSRIVYIRRLNDNALVY